METFVDGNVMRQEIKKAVTELVLTAETLVSENTPVGVTGFARAGIQGKVIRHNLGVVQATGPGARGAAAARPERACV